MAARAIPAPADALTQLRAIVGRLDHAALGLLIEAAIDEADDREGDPDLEPPDEPVLHGKLGDHPWIDDDAEEETDDDDDAEATDCEARQWVVRP